MKILIADDHTVVRQGFKGLLERLPGVEAVYEASDGESALKTASEELPEVAVLDLMMPGMNGIAVMEKLCDTSPDTAALALSAYLSPEPIEAFLSAGGKGFLLKTCSFEELTQAIDVVSKGGVYVSPEASSFISTNTTGRASGKDGKKLSGRERQILSQLAEGRSIQTIASTLEISPKTVETHKKRMMDKLGIFTIAELTKYAIKIGITNVEA